MDDVSGSFTQDLPSSWQIEEASAQPVEPLADVCAAVKAQLAAPTAALPLTDLCGPGTTVTLVCDAPPNNGTRAMLLRSVLSQLEFAGVDPDKITLLIAAQAEDIARDNITLFDSIYSSRVRVVRHDPDDLRDLDDLGNFEGVPLTVNYRAAEANLLIAMSVMRLDDDAFDAGSTGTITSGLMSTATTRELHTTRFLDDQTEPAIYTRPLFERVVREGARRAGLVFAVDAIDDAQGYALAVRAGAPNAVNDALTQDIMMMREAGVASTSYDVVVVDTSRHAHRGLFNAARAAINVGLARNPVLMRGGSMILPTIANSDLGSDDYEDYDNDEERAFYDALTNASSPDLVIQQLRGRSLRPGEERAYLLAHVMQRHHIIAAGPHHEQQARTSHFLSSPNVQDAAELAESFTGSHPRALIVRNAQHSVPAFTGLSWDSSDPFEDALIELTS